MDREPQPMSSRDIPSVSAFATLRCADEQQGGVDPLAVVIASPRSDLRGKIKEYLQGTYSTHEVSRWNSLDRTISRLNPGVVLLDSELLHSSGITDLSIIRRIARKARIIVISSSSNDMEGIAGLKAGARGYCEREIAGPLLRKAVDRVCDGEIWAERRLIPLLVEQCTLHPEQLSELPVRSDRRLALLTPREREIARLIGGGASNRDIATRLLVSEGTVKAHLTAIFRKLGFSDRLQLGLFLAKPSLKIRSRH
jgi:two-component system, NarL family, nitrate/nitrite response regulator NarL